MKAKRCPWFWGSHGCKRVKGHAHDCMCDCGLVPYPDTPMFRMDKNTTVLHKNRRKD